MEHANKAIHKYSKNNSKDHDYAFFLDYIESGSNIHLRESTYRHEFLGIPTIPSIGRYSNAGYEFSRIFSVTSLELKLSSSAMGLTYEIANEKLSKTMVNLPIEIVQLLNDIPAEISQNKRTEDDNSPKQSKKQTKLTSFYKQETKSSTKGSSIPLPNPKLFGVTDKIRFKWCILNNNLMNIKLKFDKDPNVKTYNLVPHPWLFPYLSFEAAKRMVVYTPFCVGIPNSIEKSCGVEPFIEGDSSKAKHFNGINFNELRLEYSSTHLKGESLCFSPNNLRLMINEKTIISHFWIIALDELKMHNFLYYYWLINDAVVSDLVEGCANISTNLDELFLNLENVLGKDNDALTHIKSVFY